MGTRVFVRLYDGRLQQETEAEVVALPPPPLTWAGVIALLRQTVLKTANEADNADAIKSTRLFLLPSGGQGLAAELNARSLRFGMRENDHFAICLNGEAYAPPAPDAAKLASPPSAPASTNGLNSPPLSIKLGALPSLESTYSGAPPPSGNIGGAPTGTIGGPPSGNIGGGAPDGSIIGNGNGKKGNKRYRSISGKMAAIKSLGDKGLISAEDRGHLKDLLLNNDSAQLQEALDAYNNTGDFHAVKELLVKELNNPSVKRPAGEWLSESLINDIAMNFNTSDAPAMNNNSGHNPFMFRGSNDANSYSQPSPVSSEYVGPAAVTPNPASSPAQVHPNHSPMAPTSAPTYPQKTMQWPNNGYSHQQQQQQQPQPQQHHQQQHHQQHPQTPPSNVFASQINLPLRNRNSVNLLMKQRSGYGGYNSPSVPMMGQATPTGANQMYGNAQYGNQMSYQQQQQQAMGYGMGMNQYVQNGMMQSPMGGAYNPMMQQQQAYGMNPYAYAGMTPTGMSGYDYYGAYGYNGMKADMGRGKWATPPMPSYPPPCSKEEKKEKIARWLKKREHRNWSNKPSYPVRHSIAKSRKRGEDGRFITKAKLAEMAAAEAAANAASGGSACGLGDDDDTNPLSDSSFTGSAPPTAVAS